MPEYSNDQIDQVRELERAVLGGLMLETERYDNVRLVISHADFHENLHERLPNAHCHNAQSRASGHLRQLFQALLLGQFDRLNIQA